MTAPQLPAVRTITMRTARDFIEHLARLHPEDLADRAESLGLASDAFHSKFLLAFTSRIGFPDDADACWVWHGRRQGAGYGLVSVRDSEDRWTSRGAHRVAHVLGNGGLEHPRAKVLHSCDNPQCVNPAHLRSGTAADNMADASARGRLHSTPVLTPIERLHALPTIAARYQRATGCGRAEMFRYVSGIFGVSANYASRLYDEWRAEQSRRLFATLAGKPLPFHLATHDVNGQVVDEEPAAA